MFEVGGESVITSLNMLSAGKRKIYTESGLLNDLRWLSRSHTDTDVVESMVIEWSRVLARI